jgi:rubredoxin-NAD+ reductase
MRRPSVMRCQVCGFIYRPEEGMPECGIRPGTPWQDIPDDWCCPDCGTFKREFHMVEHDENTLAY